MAKTEEKQRQRVRCPYCHSPILGAFDINDHYFSNYECGMAAKKDKRIPENFLVSLFVPV